MDWNRTLSGLLSAIYIIAAYIGGGSEVALKVVIFVVLPLACIWFGDAMGDYIGPTSGGAITGPTPGWLVCAGGWLLLLLPIIIGVTFTLVGSKP